MTFPPGRMTAQAAAAIPAAISWAILASGSAVLAFLLSLASLPAAGLIGPLLVAVAFGVANAPIRLPRQAFTAAQGVVGCLLASAVTPALLHEIALDWPALVFGVAFTAVASGLIGWVGARFGSMPGATAAWGTAPGAASAMIAMAQEHRDSDPAMVATMQYVRVLCVVLAATFVSRLLVTAPAAAVPAPPPLAEHGRTEAALAVAATFAVAIGGAWLGRALRAPAGGLMVPLAIGAVLNLTGAVRLHQPAWLLALAYAGIGWSIGLQFKRDTLRRSFRALPEMLGAALAIIGLCGFAAWVLVRTVAIDPLTAFLATSPGGIDTVAIVALSGGANLPFVMALQTLRLLAVVVTGAPIARLVARAARSRDRETGDREKGATG